MDDDSPGVDGYATFPAEATETNDGVVVATFAFGYQKGRTKSIVATHELGHYFNLLHIWGDDDCGNDLVADTPTAKKDNEGCPTFPHNVNSSCSPGPKGEMFMNYMDYSDAACVVMFSQGQKARMQATLATLRASLTRSMGCSAAGSTGVRNVASGPALKISPNPSVGTFRISSVESTLAVTSISVYNQLGGLVSQLDQVNGLPQEINLQDMPDGVYVVRVSSPAGVSSQIIVKAH